MSSPTSLAATVTPVRASTGFPHRVGPEQVRARWTVRAGVSRAARQRERPSVALRGSPVRPGRLRALARRARRTVVVASSHSGGVRAPRPSGATGPSRPEDGPPVSQPGTERPPGGVTGTTDAVRPRLGDPELRARRLAVVLAGHLGDEPAARAGLGEESAVVRASALGALERLGALDDTTLGRSCGDPDPVVRRRACELAATRPTVDLRGALDDTDPLVAEMAAWALGEQGATTAIDALAQMATGHDDPLCREAAVAALGAIGDRRGLPVVLAALDDRPAIRRRAAVALAAFDHPSADDGLRRCLTDRDWQVRQVAEDLLGVDPA
ncbi:MAG: HEAT repeat domain-containing protein [Actinomycetota bacterium]|nr:HEAT repeat domain-containing protein [Actinomycetota bacterium]